MERGDTMEGGSLALTLPEGVVDELARRVAVRLGEVPRDDGYLDVAGAAEFLACGRDRVYALVSAGARDGARLPHYRDGRRLLFKRSELHAYVARGGAKRP